MILRVWSLDQQHHHLLEILLRCKFLGCPRPSEREGWGEASLLVPCPLGVWCALRSSTAGTCFLHAVAWRCLIKLQPGLTPPGSCPPFRPLSCWAGSPSTPGSVLHPSASLPSQGCSPRPGLSNPLSLSSDVSPGEAHPNPVAPRDPPRHCLHHRPTCSWFPVHARLHTFLFTSQVPTAIGHLPQGEPDTSTWKLTPKI